MTEWLLWCFHGKLVSQLSSVNLWYNCTGTVYYYTIYNVLYVFLNLGKSHFPVSLFFSDVTRSWSSSCWCLLISSCRFGAVFLWDSGSSVGEVSGHAKLINSVDIRQKRPYRLATASDDTCGSFYEGPPFKFKFTLTVSFFLVCFLFCEKGHLFLSKIGGAKLLLLYPYKGNIFRLCRRLNIVLQTLQYVKALFVCL